MKSKIQTLVCSALLAASISIVPALNAQAEKPERPEKPAQSEKPARPERPDRPAGAGQRGDRLKQLTEQLGLTEAQVEQLKPILAAQQEETRAVRESATADSDRTAIRAKMQAIREKYQGQIAAVLTDEQKAKWAKLMERGPRQGGPGGGSGTDGATPPPPPATPPAAE